jgi:hypothetical protein
VRRRLEQRAGRRKSKEKQKEQRSRAIQFIKPVSWDDNIAGSNPLLSLDFLSAFP